MLDKICLIRRWKIVTDHFLKIWNDDLFSETMIWRHFVINCPPKHTLILTILRSISFGLCCKEASGYTSELDEVTITWPNCTEMVSLAEPCINEPANEDTHAQDLSLSVLLFNSLDIESNQKFLGISNEELPAEETRIQSTPKENTNFENASETFKIALCCERR